MENAGASCFADSLLLFDEHATGVLGRVRETIDNCIALKQAVGPQLQTALAAAR